MTTKTRTRKKTGSVHVSATSHVFESKEDQQSGMMYTQSSTLLSHLFLYIFSWRRHRGVEKETLFLIMYYPPELSCRRFTRISFMVLCLSSACPYLFQFPALLNFFLYFLSLFAFSVSFLLSFLDFHYLFFTSTSHKPQPLLSPLAVTHRLSATKRAKPVSPLPESKGNNEHFPNHLYTDAQKSPSTQNLSSVIPSPQLLHATTATFTYHSINIVKIVYI